MTVDVTRALHAAMFTPDGSTLVVVGDRAEDELLDIAGDDVRFVAPDGVADDDRSRRRADAAAGITERRACRDRAAGRRAIGAAHRPRVRAAIDAGLSHAPDPQHHPRRRVREPAESESARIKGLHLRRAHRIQPAPRHRPVRDADERRHRRDGPGDSRSPRRDSRDRRRPAGDAGRSAAGVCVAQQGLSARLRNRRPGCTFCRTTCAAQSCRYVFRGICATPCASDRCRRQRRRPPIPAVRQNERRDRRGFG